jgi:hypothetical protein
MSKLWTKEEENKLVELYPTVPTEELIKILGRAKSAIVTKAYKLGIKKVIRADGLLYVYEDEEIEIIEYSKTHSIPEIERKFDRDYATIARVLKDNDCDIISSDYWWTKEQEDFLINNFYIETPEFISRFLNKKWKTITKKARQMGMNKLTSEGIPRKPPVSLTNEEKQFIMENYNKMPSAIISKKLKVKIDVILRFCEQNDLKIIRSRKNPKDYSNDLLLKKLTDFSLELGRCPTTGEIQNNFDFPSVDIYYDRFVSFSNACKLAGLEINTGMYGSICYSKNGDKCYSIQEQIITNYFIDNNIRYIKEYEYGNIIPNINSGIVMDWYIYNTVVEYFGLQNFEKYELKTKMKQNVCEENGIKIISIFPEDMKHLDKIFHDYK